MKRPLAASEKRDWLRLARTDRVGGVTFHRLIARFGSAGAAFEALPRLTGGPVAAPTLKETEAELAAIERAGARLVCACEPAYPALLAEIDAPPPVLILKGRSDLLARPCVALVGAREASAAGLKLAAIFARGLGEAGVTVVSGLARGVDGAAHAASLETGAVAVIAGGLDRPYPPQHATLHDRIAEDGLLVTEAPLGHQARARDFPRRNRVISGLSLAVVVIEAALRSGSLITARSAGDQGRDVMAVPGNPLDPRARGANALLKDGATLVEGPEDVLAAIAAAPRPIRKPRLGPLFDDADDAAPTGDLGARLATLLSTTPTHVNDLARLLAAPVGAVAAALTELEFDGRAASLPGGYAVRASPT